MLNHLVNQRCIYKIKTFGTVEIVSRRSGSRNAEKFHLRLVCLYLMGSGSHKTKLNDDLPIYLLLLMTMLTLHLRVTESLLVMLNIRIFQGCEPIMDRIFDDYAILPKAGLSLSIIDRLHRIIILFF